MTIQHIMQQSKDLLLKHGEYPPTIFVDFASGHRGKQLLLDKCPDNLSDFHKVVFLIGREKSEELPEEDIASLCFVCECEAVRHNINDPKDVTKREVLLFQMLEVLPPEQGESKQTLKLSLHFVEMIRDGSGTSLTCFQTMTPSLPLLLTK